MIKQYEGGKTFSRPLANFTKIATKGNEMCQFKG